MDHRCLVQVSEFSHIVGLVKLGRVDFIDALGFHLALLL
jgi:hypothetical protein